MIKRLIGLAFSIVLTTAGAGLAQVRPPAPSIAALFGPRVSAESGVKAPYFVGFLTGGHAPDKVYIVHLAPRDPKRPIGKDVTVLDPWAIPPVQHITPSTAHRALAIINGDSGRKFILAGADDRDFLGSPIWTARPLPLNLVRKGSRRFVDFARDEKAIQHDVLSLGTEAGIDIALYWNGTTYRIFWPNEEP